MSWWLPTTVTCAFTAELVVPEEGSVALSVVFHYDVADPFAVHATFRTGHGDGVRWVFARELLTVGVAQSVGDGDVKVWPSWDVTCPSIFIGLASPDGEAVFCARARDLHDFLDRSYSLCPEGQELEHCDVDAAIDALCAS